MSDPELNLLVLAAGGNVSEGILKSLALCPYRMRVVGADIGALKMGLYAVDKAVISPWANEAAFLPWLMDTCKRERIHGVFSGAEPVLPVLARHAETIRRESGAVCVVSDPETLAIGDDKLLTSQWLAAEGFPHPDSAASEDRENVTRLVETYGFPLIAKPRQGGGCRGHFKLEEPPDVEYAMRKRGYIIQQMVGHAGEEYTAGAFCDRDGIVRGVIAMRRELHEGTTVAAEAGDFPEVEAAARAITERLRPMGPCNIQMRMHEGKAVCLEINVRFSGTTPVRARFGFNEVDAAIRHYVLGQPLDTMPVVRKGVMLRYWNEIYLDPDIRDTLGDYTCFESPRRFLRQTEDFTLDRRGCP